MLTAVLFGTGAVLVLIWLLSSPFYWKMRGVPSIIPLPLMGSMLPLVKKSVRQFWSDMYYRRKENKYFGFHFFTSPALLIKEPEIIRNFLSSDNFLSMGLYANEDIDLMSSSIIFASGDTWRQTRSKLSPFFTTSRIKEMMPITEESLKLLMPLYEKHANSSEPLNIQQINMGFSTDIITKSAFGLESDAFEENSFLIMLQSELLKTRSLLIYFLGLLSPWLIDFLRLKSFREYLYREFRRVIGGSISQREQGIPVRPDFIQGMVELKKKANIPNTDNIKLLNVDDDFIIAQGISLYMAGTESVGTTLSFVLYELSLHQEIQEKVRHEIIEVTTRTGFIEHYDQIMELNYLSMVINEVLRLYGIVPVIIRKCTKDYDLDDFTIKKETIIIIPEAAINRDPKYFPDPDRFNPDRFGPGNKLHGIFTPFGYGQRMCIGMKYGLMNLTLALSRILLKYRVSPCTRTEYPITLHPKAITTTPYNGVWLNIEHIS